MSIFNYRYKRSTFGRVFVLNNHELQFIGATNLPKMGIVGTTDPYFIARIDNAVAFVCITFFKRMTLGFIEVSSMFQKN